jgi:hypothetical protein
MITVETVPFALTSKLIHSVSNLYPSGACVSHNVYFPAAKPSMYFGSFVLVQLSFVLPFAFLITNFAPGNSSFVVISCLDTFVL